MLICLIMFNCGFDLNLSVPVYVYVDLFVGRLVTYEVKIGNLTVQDLHVDLSVNVYLWFSG